MQKYCGLVGYSSRLVCYFDRPVSYCLGLVCFSSGLVCYKSSRLQDSDLKISQLAWKVKGLSEIFTDRPAKVTDCMVIFPAQSV